MATTNPESFARTIIGLAAENGMTVGEFRMAADIAKTMANKSVVSANTNCSVQKIEKAKNLLSDD